MYIIFRKTLSSRALITGKTAPHVHETYEEASVEAVRLAEGNPGSEFVIFQAVAVASQPRLPAHITKL